MGNFLYRYRILLFATTSLLVSLLVLIVFFLSLNPSKQASPQPHKLVVPTEILRQISMTPIIIQEKNIRQFSSRVIKNMRWINEKELSYTFYDVNLRRQVVAKTDLNQESILLNDPNIKIPEFYWSNNFTLLILDYRDPNISYLLMPNNQLITLNFSGYGYSWSPLSNSIFYTEYPNGQTQVGKIYNVLTQSSTTINNNLPSFSISFWSPKDDEILLYDQRVDSQHSWGPFEGNDQANKLYLLTRSNGTFVEIERNVSFPAWSPDGNRISYIAQEGLYVKNSNSNKGLVFKTGTPYYISYAWLNDDEILLIDTTPQIPQVWKISLTQRTKNLILANVSFQNNQRIEFAVNPSKKVVAIATEKDGLFFLDL